LAFRVLVGSDQVPNPEISDASVKPITQPPIFLYVGPVTKLLPAMPQAQRFPV
jgi:hypothetical protein